MSSSTTTTTTTSPTANTAAAAAAMVAHRSRVHHRRMNNNDNRRMPLLHTTNGTNTVEEKKEDTNNTHNNNNAAAAAASVIYRDVTPEAPPPGPIFHPDFMFCGACTDCNKPTSSGGQPQPLYSVDDDDDDDNNSVVKAAVEQDVLELTTLHHAATASSSSTNEDNGSGEEASNKDAVRLRTMLLLNHHWKSPHHALTLQSLLQPVPGVAVVQINLHDTTVGAGDGLKSTVLVHHDATCQDEDLLRVLRQGGYPATICERRYSEPVVVTGRDELMGRRPNNNNHNNAAANDNNDDDAASFVVRSTLFVQNICCASEVPSIRKIIKPIPGVASLQINITTRRVYVHHDCQTVTATDIATRLTQLGFPATVLVNGDQKHAGVGGAGADATSSVGRSTLQSQTVLHDQDIPKLQQALIKVAGVKRVGVNLAESVVYVQHDLQTVSAVQIQQALQTDRVCRQYDMKLLQDAQVVQAARTSEILAQPRSLFVESCVTISNLTVRHLPILHKVLQQHYIRSAVRAVHPHVASHTCKLEHNPDKAPLAQIVACWQQYGLDAQIVTDGGVERHFLPLRRDDSPDEMAAQQAMQEWHANDLQFHVVLSGIFWTISLLATIQNGHGVFGYLEYAGLLSVFFGLPPVMAKAYRTVRRCEFDANCMMVIAAVGALVLGELSEAASVSFLFCVSEWLESRASQRARIALQEIVRLRPDHANVLHPDNANEIVVVQADQVPVGSLISVRTGDKIAADGVVVEGTSSVDESSLTGESVPARKTVGDVVSGGSINIGSTQLVVRTTTSVDDSTVSRLIRLVEEAQANRSPTETMIDGFARAYTPVVVLAAFFMATIPWMIHALGSSSSDDDVDGSRETARQWTMNALIIIVIACPCALTISTPVTYAAGLAATAQRGIVVKGGASLEALGSVDKVILDKTGTITEGKFAVTHLELIQNDDNNDNNDGAKNSHNYTREQMLQLLALMEAPSSHPLSATLVRAAKSEGVSVPTDVTVEQHTILKGEGVTAQVAGKTVYVGNRRLFERIGMYQHLSEKYKDLAEQWSQEGGSVGFLGVEGDGIIGSFGMSDVIRSEARSAIQSIRRGGIDVVMLTGDGDGAAQTVAQEVGIVRHNVHSQLLPEDKLHFIAGLKRPTPKRSFGIFRRQPKVLFCGDGVNDGPALAAADIGVSMGEGAALAMEMSDVTLMDSNLSKLLYIIQMGTRVMHTIQENIVMSLFCKLLVVALTFAGKMTLLYAIASDVGVMLIVTVNGMKLLPGGGANNNNNNNNSQAVEMGRMKGIGGGGGGYDEEAMMMMDDASERRPLHGGGGGGGGGLSAVANHDAQVV